MIVLFTLLFHFVFLVVKLFAGVLGVSFVWRAIVWCFKLGKNRVAVVVLGDIGRSPRMQYHALSLASHNFDVNLVGFAGSTPHSSIMNCEKIQLAHVREIVVSNSRSRVLAYAEKFVLQAYYLCAVLFNVGPTEYILIQNPPCIPGLFVCLLFSMLNGSKLIIDWHNYGYSILALKLGRDHLLVRAAKIYEEVLGQLSSANMCVTKAMCDDLYKNWKVSASVMHDRPGPLFKPISLKEKHELFEKLAQEYPQFQSSDELSNNKITFINENDEVERRKNCPVILISSTSWTEDEDFQILIDALDEFDAENSKKVSNKLPDVLCVVTGKGPRKAYYKRIIETKNWNHVEIVTPWLEADDYPKMLASSDYGVSLHASSSGLDLPMKVVDMFGSQLPVLALDFNCLHELVRHGENGYVFRNSNQLKQQICDLLIDMTEGKSTKANKFRLEVDKFRCRSWVKAWDEIVQPCFK